MLEIHFSQLSSNNAYFKVCFKVQKFGRHIFFHIDPYYVLSTSVLNDITNIYVCDLFLYNNSSAITHNQW